MVWRRRGLKRLPGVSLAKALLLRFVSAWITMKRLTDLGVREGVCGTLLTESSCVADTACVLSCLASFRSSTFGNGFACCAPCLMISPCHKIGWGLTFD